MKYTTQELLLAAAVKNLVLERQIAYAQEMNMTDAQRHAFMEAPVNDLIAEVVKELDGYARVIASVKTKAQ